MTDYQIMCQHLPANHTKTETPSEAVARYQVSELTRRGEKAAYAANHYGTFTVFKWA
jgi:hypothetical protein